MLITSLIVATLAVARVTLFIWSDKLSLPFRQWVVRKWGPSSKPSVLVHCPWCVSVWVSAAVMPFAVAFPNRWLIGVLAIPAAALIAGWLADKAGS